MMANIDWSKPIETVDGTPARVVKHLSSRGLRAVEVDGHLGVYYVEGNSDRSSGGALQFRNVEPKERSYSFWGILDKFDEAMGILDKFDEAMGRPFTPAWVDAARRYGPTLGPDAPARAHRWPADRVSPSRDRDAEGAARGAGRADHAPIPGDRALPRRAPGGFDPRGLSCPNPEGNPLMDKITPRFQVQGRSIVDHIALRPDGSPDIVLVVHPDKLLDATIQEIADLLNEKWNRK